jgi:hypothetical protein
MTRDPDPAGPSHPIDDDDVARLVREVAEGWVMPPVRLDQPSWRDRVRSPRERRAASVKGFFGRLGQAASAAVVLTLAAALIAVYLTGPRTDVGQSPQPSSRRTPSPSQAAAASPMPKLFVTGDLPSPAKVVVELAGGDFAVADLASGTLGSALTASSWGSQVRRAPNGNLVCVCISTDGYAQGNSTHVSVALERYDGSGKVVARDIVLDVTGHPDPRDGQLMENPGHVSAFATFSADGRSAFVGWSARNHPSWISGIVVVDLDSGSVVQRLDLPAVSDGPADSRTYVDAPRVVGMAGSRAVIDRNSYSWSPPASSSPSYHFGSDVFTADAGGGSLGTPVALALGSGCGDDVNLAGGLTDGGIWLSCAYYAGEVMTKIRRIAGDGSLAGDVSVKSAGVEGSTTAISPDGGLLYLWNPISLVLTRVDLATGATDTSTAPKPAAGADLLTAIGRWLAPSAAAKMFLQAGIAISPDGNRIYALGFAGNPATAPFAGSAGVLVFDAHSLAPLDRWAPTADFVSVAVSADGTVVYAAGAADVDAGGGQTSQQASITVFDATDGSIRLIAGQLGRTMLNFSGTTLK